MLPNPLRSLLLALMVLAMPLPALASPGLAPENACAAAAAQQEQAAGIPPKLLHAISLVESGRYDSERKASFAWPWTVMAEGKGRFLPTKEAAIEEVATLRARGVRNIDVGCMQINLKHHPNAFDTLDEAFDPASNVAYAAKFLGDLYEATGDWTRAGSYYHSQTPDLAAAYRERLLRAWDKAGDAPTAVAGLAKPPVPGVSVRKATPDVTVWALSQQKMRETQTRLATEREQQKAKLTAERAEARRVADVWRRAKLVQYVCEKTAPGAPRKLAPENVPERWRTLKEGCGASPKAT